MNEEINNKLQRGLALTVKESWELYKYIKALELTELNPSYNSVKTELEPCEDCISREQAVYVASGYCAPQNIADELRKLPSVNSQRKRG